MKTLLIAAAMAATMTAGQASATGVLSDNTAASYGNADMSNIFTYENACGCGPAFSAGVADSFTLSSRSRVTQVQAALVALQQNEVPTFTSFADTKGYSINIYSSAAAFGASLTGDVFSTVVSAAAGQYGAALNLAYDGVQGFDLTQYVLASTLATFDIDTYLDAGTYYLSVIGVNDPDENESIGVAMSGPSGNSMFSNPNGGFAPDDFYGHGQMAGYAVLGEVAPVPEPGEWAMMIVGLGVAGVVARRRQKQLVAA